MFGYMKSKYKNAEIEFPLSADTINDVSEECTEKFGTSLPEEYIMFLRELNGFYCNGYSVFGCYDDEKMNSDAGLSRLDFLTFNERFRDYSEVEDYLILGKSSIDYIAYEIDSQQYTLITNGTLDVLYQSDSFNSVLSKYLEDL